MLKSVCEYQSIFNTILFWVLRHLNGLKAVDAEIHRVFNIYAEFVKDGGHAGDAELLIVDNENAILLEDMELVFQGAWEGLERPNVV